MALEHGKSNVTAGDEILTWRAPPAQQECPELRHKRIQRDAQGLAECSQPNRWAMPEQRFEKTRKKCECGNNKYLFELQSNRWH